MKGVIVEKAGGELQVVENLEKPEPSSDQILVKSVYMAINPVDSIMIATGLMVTSWPFVFGCDGAGVVVQVGDKAADKFKIGDEVCGCARLGTQGHSTAQEFFLMDAALTFPKPKNISFQQAATLGAGSLTAALGLFNGLNIQMPDPDNLPMDKSDEKDETNETVAETKTEAESPPKPKEDDWVIVLGGASSIGKYAIQLAKAAGYKVAASCSAKSAELVVDLGAVPFDYKKPTEHQVEEVMSITSRKPFRIFDAAATGDELATELFKLLPGDTNKYFATTSAPESTHIDIAGCKQYQVLLGLIGRPESTDLNRDIEKFIPFIVALVEKEKIRPNPYDIVGGGGFHAVIEALKYQQKGAGGSNKVLAKVQDP